MWDLIQTNGMKAWHSVYSVVLGHRFNEFGLSRLSQQRNFLTKVWSNIASTQQVACRNSRLTASFIVDDGIACFRRVSQLSWLNLGTKRWH